MFDGILSHRLVLDALVQSSYPKRGGCVNVAMPASLWKEEEDANAVDTGDDGTNPRDPTPPNSCTMFVSMWDISSLRWRSLLTLSDETRY